jgi:hypothetical protein
MTGEAVRVWFIAGFTLVYLALIFAGLWYARKSRTTRWPFKDADKLLRGPGEGLRRRINEIGDALAVEMMVGLFGMFCAWTLLAFVAKWLGLSGWPALTVIILGMLAFALLSVRRIIRLWQERANHFLGWFGERLAAEKLRPLQMEGYLVFHDVPASPGANGFNIDHVVVGPAGISIVEVKTRRKGNARSGRADHEVRFDGSALDWPWGTDGHGVQQAINEADWISKWVQERTGLRIRAKAILTLPGWYVRETPNPAIRVVNPSFLPDAVRGRGEILLTSKEIDLIGRQLDHLCRDVED